MGNLLLRRMSRSDTSREPGSGIDSTLRFDPALLDRILVTAPPDADDPDYVLLT